MHFSYKNGSTILIYKVFVNINLVKSVVLLIKWIENNQANNGKRLSLHPRATIEASSPQDPDGVSLGGRGLQTKA